MTDVIASLALEMDARPLTQPADASTAALGKIGDAAVAAQTKVSAASKEMGAAQAAAREEAKRGAAAREQLIGAFEREAAAIRAKSTVMLSEVEVYRKVMQARRDALALADRERAETVAWVQDLKRKEEAAAAAAVPVAGVGRAAAGTATGLRTMSTGLANLAAQEIGLRSGLGSLLGAVGNFGLGALTSLGVFAGLAAISLAWNQLTSASRQAQQAMDDTVKALRAANGPALSLGASITILNDAIEETKQKGPTFLRFLKELAVGDTFNPRQIFENLRSQDEAKVAELERVKAGATRRLQAEREAEDKKRADELKRQADAAKNAHEERLKQLRILGDAERQAALERASNTADELAALAAIRDAKIAAQVAGSGLKSEEAERLRVLLLQSAQLTEQNALLSEQARIAAAVANQQAAFLAAQEALIAKLRQAPGDMAHPSRFGPTGLRTQDGLFSDADARELLKERQEQLAGAAAKSREELTRFLSELGLLPRSLVAAANAVSALIESAKADAAKTADYLRVAAQVLAGFITGRSVAASGARGVLGGAAAGATIGSVVPGIGTVVGGVVGGIFGGIGGLLGGGKQRREDIRAYREQQDAFRQQGIERTPLDATLADLQRQFVALRAEAIRLKQPVGALTTAYASQVAQAQAAFAAQQQAFREDLTVRETRAQGRTEEAEALALQYQQQRELQAAMKAGYDANALGQLIYVQGLEREAYFKAQAAAVQRKLNEQIGIGLSLDEQLFGAKGDPAGAARARREAGIFDTGLKLQSGALSPENAQKTFDLIWLTFKNTMQALADAAEAATLALYKYNRATQEEAGLRILAAQARLSGNAADQERYETARKHADQQKQIDEATANGATEATLAAIRLAQAWEDQADTVERLRRKEEELRKTREFIASANEDTRVRELKAAGQDAAAEDLARRNRNRKEIDDLIQGGADADTITYRKKVQQDEIRKADEDRRAAQQRAFDQAFPTTTAGVSAQSATSVNLAVGVSESTAGRMAGLLTSQLVVAQQALQSHVRRERLLERIEAAVHGGGRARGGGGGASFQQLDETWAVETAVGERVAGNPPSNR